jgi:hypothetical protein
VRPQDLPLVGRLLAFGPDDVVYDSLILLGPVVVLLFTLAGRSPVTVAAGMAYVAVFVVAVARRVTRAADA